MSFLHRFGDYTNKTYKLQRLKPCSINLRRGMALPCLYRMQIIDVVKSLIPRSSGYLLSQPALKMTVIAINNKVKIQVTRFKVASALLVLVNN
jgi:hypothetical protein